MDGKGVKLREDEPLKIAIGIDPGLQTGVCIWNMQDQKIEKLCKTDFWGAIEILDRYQVKTMVNEIDLKVFIENPAANKPVFQKRIAGIQEQRKINKIADNIGQNKKEGLLLIAYCHKRGIAYDAVTPKQSKLKPEFFMKLHKLKKKPSQHEVDAAMLVQGRRA